MDKGFTILELIKATGCNETIAKYMLSQMCHETAVNGIPFESKIFKDNNNVCGMKYAGQVNSLGEKNGYAYYLTINQSIADLVAWYSRNRMKILSTLLYIDTLAKYVRFLKNYKYFEAPENEYLSGCLYFYNKYFNEQ